MESTVTSESQSFEVPGGEPAAARDELRVLRRLRERVEVAVNELERLRAENVALATRVVALEGGEVGAPVLDLPLSKGEDMRAKLDGFIAAIDQALRDASAPADVPARPTAGN
jgi:hypothetical protein